MGKTTKRFEELEIWKLARKFCRNVWTITRVEPFSKDYSLKDQINRSSGSTMDNIAEGHDRGGNKEFVHFLTIARASNSEARSQLVRAYDRKHINREDFEILYKLNVEIGVKTTKFIKSIQSNGFKGNKFK